MNTPPAEIEHRAASDREQVAWVDEYDRLLGGLPRAELRARGLIGRGTFIFLLNGQGHLCVHQRVMSKAVYPGYFDVAAGGMVAPDEPYEIAAARELEEELGIGGVALRDHGRFFFDAPDNRLWGAIYSAVSDAPLRLQPEEVAAAWFMPLDDVLADIEQRPYCPDSRVALRRFLANR
ncbi:NUDIX hydrolase [Pseudomonas sp. Marseille-QA0892]